MNGNQLGGQILGVGLVIVICALFVTALILLSGDPLETSGALWRCAAFLWVVYSVIRVGRDRRKS